ncbi:MAG: hypothetical protein KDD44_04115 [Bdellovibrionales bacterium]|nr:hypothetical protein [Bdellovibrionales bacterium]
MSQDSSLTIHNAWNSVALEERLELISRSKAVGCVAGAGFLLLVGSIAYGLDEIWLLAGGALGSVFVMQLFASYAWRRGKPELILKYLAARSVARRYAYGYNILDLDVVLIFRGKAEEEYIDREEEEIVKGLEDVEFGTTMRDKKSVWICLMRGALVLLSERGGGARLEYLTPLTEEVLVSDEVVEDGVTYRKILVEGAGPAKNKILTITSDYPGALYVLARQLERLIAESGKRRARLEAAQEAENAVRSAA